LRIKKGLSDLGISQDFVQIHKNKKSNLSVIINFQGERTALVYHQDWNYQLPKLANTSWIYFTSISQSFTQTNIVDEVCHFVDRSKCKFAYSPGTYQLKADVKRFPKLLEKCDLFVVNLEEAKKVLGIAIKDRIQISDLLSKLLLLGPKNVVITDGAEGSYGSNGQNNFKVGTLPVHIYEKTGAGDSYTAAVISALHYGLDLGEAMVWGTHNSASTIQKLGPQNGLLSRNEIERNRRTIKDLVANRNKGG